MKRSIKLFVALLVCGILNQFALHASSHREAPLITADPLADNTDVYAFKSPCDTTKIVLIANYIPFEHPAGGPNYYTFGENIRYEIHVKNQAGTAGDDITYRFTFHNMNQDPTTFFNIRLGQQNLKTTYTLEKGNNAGVFTTIITNGIVPANNIGPRSIDNPVLGLNVPNYDTLMNRAVMMATTGEKVFAGPIDDPFFVDLGGAFDVGGFRKTGRDGLAKYNCHSLVIEVPVSSLQQSGLTTKQATSILDPNFVIGVYASASRQTMTTFDSTGGKGTSAGNWVQVSRLGMPLTNEAVIPIGQKDKWNGTITNSTGDTAFAKFFKNPELALYMDDSKFGMNVPGLSALRIQTKSLGAFDFRNGKKGLAGLKGSAALNGTALAQAAFGDYLLPDTMSPRAVDLLPIFNTGVPNLRPYQLATGKNGDPLAAGKPFINNFLPTFGDMLRLNMAVPVTPRNSPDFSTLGLVGAAVLGLTDSRFTNPALQFIPNMDGFPNGRRLEDDVTTIELQAVGGVVLAAIGLWYDDYPGTGSPVTPQLMNVLGFNAGVTHNDTTFKACFPYVQAPWRGFVGASFVGPVNPETPQPGVPFAFMGCPNINLAVARPGYNTYNGEPITIYNVDTTTGKATPIAGGPLKDMPTGRNIDVNGAGLNYVDQLLYAIRDTTNSAGTAMTALLYRIGSNYANYPVGTLPTPALSSGDNIAYVNGAAGTFDDQGNYYYTAVTGAYSYTNLTFKASTFYIGKINNVAALTSGTAALSPTWTKINFSNANCAGFLSNISATYSSNVGAAAGTGFEDITYSNVYKNIYLFEAFKSTNGQYVDQLFGINPGTGVATCYSSFSGLGASNNEVSGISTTANGSIMVFFTGGDIYKTDILSSGDYAGTLTKMGATGITPAGVIGSIRGDLASCGSGLSTLPAVRTSAIGSTTALPDAITAYPNPVRGLTTIGVQQSLTNATVRLMGVSGNVISTQSGISGYNFMVDLTNKPSGLYIVEILQGGNVRKVKLIKQ